MRDQTSRDSWFISEGIPMICQITLERQYLLFLCMKLKAALSQAAFPLELSATWRAGVDSQNWISELPKPLEKRPFPHFENCGLQCEEEAGKNSLNSWNSWPYRSQSYSAWNTWPFLGFTSQQLFAEMPSSSFNIPQRLFEVGHNSYASFLLLLIPEDLSFSREQG